MLSQVSLMSLAATALVLIGVGLALRALVLLVPDREPGGETLPSSLGRLKPCRLRLIHGGKKGSQGGSR
jgi:hypothetical protein